LHRAFLSSATWFRKSVLEYVGAQKALNDITGSMLSQELIWKTLWELACRRNEREEKASQWYSMAGLPLVRLRRFPKKARGWADEFELMLREFQKNRAYGSVAASLALYLQHGQRAEMKNGRVPNNVASNILDNRADFSKMVEIPQMLRVYADYFEAVCKVTAPSP
jgi:hypothetical protein